MRYLFMILMLLVVVTFAEVKVTPVAKAEILADVNCQTGDAAFLLGTNRAGLIINNERMDVKVEAELKGDLNALNIDMKNAYVSYKFLSDIVTVKGGYFRTPFGNATSLNLVNYPIIKYGIDGQPGVKDKKVGLNFDLGSETFCLSNMAYNDGSGLIGGYAGKLDIFGDKYNMAASVRYEHQNVDLDYYVNLTPVDLFWVTLEVMGRVTNDKYIGGYFEFGLQPTDKAAYVARYDISNNEYGHGLSVVSVGALYFLSDYIVLGLQGYGVLPLNNGIDSADPVGIIGLISFEI